MRRGLLAAIRGGMERWRLPSWERGRDLMLHQVGGFGCYQGFSNFFVFSLNFLFCAGVQPVNKQCCRVSGEHTVHLVVQWLTYCSSEIIRDSPIHIPVYILPQPPLLSRLLHNTKQSSICYTVGPCWLIILSIAVCTCPSQTPYLIP